MSITLTLLTTVTDHARLLAASPGPISLAADPTPSITGAGITGWMKDNAVPIVIFIIALVVLMAARAGNTSKTFTIVGLTVMGLMVVAIGADSALGLGIGKWALSLFGVKA